MNCIWKCAEEDRHCDLCLYDKCFKRKPPKPEEEPEVLPTVSEADKREKWWYYLQAMNKIVGRDIRTKKKDAKVVWGRMFLAYQLSLDGYTSLKIGRIINRDHATVLYALRIVRDMLYYPWMYSKAMEIWNEFQNTINLQKK